MVLVLFICAILIVIMILIISLLLSTIRINVKDYNISNLNVKKTKYKITISLYLLNKIKWLSFKLNKEKLHKISLKMHLDRIDIKKLEKDFKLSDIKELMKIKPKLTLLHLDLKLGIQDILLTTYIIPVVCTIFSLILPIVTEEKNIKHIRYKAEPIYNQNNVYYIKLTSRVEIKMINLLNSMYGIYKNRKDNMPQKDKTINLNKNKIECNV